MNKTEIEAIVDELVAVKIQLKALQSQERILKKQLEPQIKQGDALSNASAEIYCAESEAKKYIRRSDVLEYLIEKYGEDIAQEVDLHCANIRLSSRNVRIRLKID